MPKILTDESERKVAFSTRISKKNKDFIEKYDNYAKIINDLITDFKKGEMNKNDCNTTNKTQY